MQAKEVRYRGRQYISCDIIENPESIFSFLSSVGKTELRIQPKKLKLSTVNRKVLEITSRYKCNKTTRGNARNASSFIALVS